MPSATVFNASFRSVWAIVLSLGRGGLKEEGQLHRLEADRGNLLGTFLHLGKGTALEHHAQLDVVLGRFACVRFGESACGDSGRSDGPEKMPSRDRRVHGCLLLVPSQYNRADGVEEI